jgi:predicted RND superfamily exporter protein
LQQSYDSLLQSGYLRIDPVDGAELWRVSLRLAAFRDVDYAQFSSDLRRVVDPVVAKYNEDGVSHPFHPGQRQSTKVGERPRLTAVYTGVVPIVYKAQRALLDSLMQSTFWSFATITPLLMFVSRGARAGVVAMLPNVLPVLVVFGGMGWLRLPVDIGSMMSASIALGVAVDDTIHFLTWFREDLKHSGDRRAAILNAYQRCATPTLQAALISGVGLSVFAFSTFTPTKQFGVMMLTILLAGVVAELVMLPALLAGPLGRVFTPTWRRQHADRDRSDVPPPFHLSQEKRPCLELDTPNCS